MVTIEIKDMVAARHQSHDGSGEPRNQHALGSESAVHDVQVENYYDLVEWYIEKACQ